MPFGLALAVLGTLAYAEVGAHTSYWLLASALLLRGMGLGATMMPAMAAGYAALAHAEVPRATTTLNILQRVGGSVGTAVLAVYLGHQIADRIPAAASGTGELGSVPPGVREQLATPLAAAFGQTFWLALGLTALVYVPALFLPRRPSAPPDEQQGWGEAAG